MPTIEWNRNWGTTLSKFVADPGDEPHFGNRWGDPNTHPDLQKIRDRFIAPFVEPSHTAMEIGFGGGRWTQFLLDFKRLYCVELSLEMCHYFLQRFGARPNVSFCQTNGTDLPGIPDGEVNFVFSFGVFVHIDLYNIREYLHNLQPKLAPGANVVIQYSEKNKPDSDKNPHFTKNTADLMRQMVSQHGFRILSEDLDTLPHANVIRFSSTP